MHSRKLSKWTNVRKGDTLGLINIESIAEPHIDLRIAMYCELFTLVILRGHTKLCILTRLADTIGSCSELLK